MSTTAKTNLQIVQDAYAAFNEGDIESVVAMMDEDIEWVEPEGSPYSGTYHGPNAVIENVFGPSVEEVEGFEVVPDRFVDGRDCVVVLGSARGTVAETGKSLDIPFAHVCDLRDGRMIRFVDYTDTHIWHQMRRP